ncbi:Rare lipoprotein A (RlpA)-like double-psi beta-barrel [compost metagenome]
MKTKKLLTLVALLLIGLYGSAQTQFWSDNFEDAGAPSSGTRTPSIAEFGCNSPATIYFKRTDLAGIALQTGSYSDYQGSKFWGCEDIDRGPGCGAQNTISAAQTISWNSINISGKTGMTFKGLFACNNSPTTWEFGNNDPSNPADYMIISYRIDGGAWTDAVRIFATNPGRVLALETTGDSIGDGTPLTSYTFTEFTANITGTGTTLDLKFKCFANGSGTEEMAIDDLRLFESPVCVTPIITANPPNRTICVNNNTTFTSNATGATAFQWQENSGSGFTDIANGGVYSNATTNVLTITGATAGMSGYQYRCRAINGIASCFTNSNNATLTISNITASTAKVDVFCFGNSTGSASVSASGGIGSYTYSWSPSGGTGSIATNLAAGSYTVTITDAILCQITKNFTITQPAAALNAATGGGKTDVACNGGTTGTATVAPTGGTPAYAYSWAPSGGTAATATGLGAGTYTVTVTDANNCQTTRNYTINQPATAISAATGGGSTNVSCRGGGNGTATVAPTGGTPAYTYSWAPSGGTAATATGLSAGTYTVTVTDANNCQAQRTFNITQPAAALSAATGGGSTNISCNGGGNGTATVAPTGGTPSYTYSWAPSGGTNATATGLSAGTYTVTVTDANACQTQRTFNLTQPAAALSAATGGGSTNISCNSGANGTATVAPTGGTPSYSYSWAPSGGTNATATGLGAGTYTVTVTDANACQTQRTFNLTQPAAALSAATGGGSTNISCNGGNNGTATVAPTGGTPSYTYSWAPSGGTTATATGLGAGTYTVTVTDANACQAQRTFNLTQPTALSAATGGGSTNISCNGGANGTATVAPTGGTPSYTYSWAPSGGTNATATGLAAGTYTVTVTDANACQTTRTFNLTQPAAALSAATGGGSTNISCNGGANGTATVAPTGGTPSYSYSWAPSGGTNATATGLGAGTYTVTVTDANACQTTRTFNLTQPAAALSAATGGGSTNISCNGGANGTATVAPTGGTPSYTYSWAPSGGTNATATGLAAGTYTVTVTDANSCQAQRTFNLTQPAAALSAATGGGKTDVSCNGGSNGTATVAPTGGTPSYSYSWAPSGGTNASATGLAAGTYTVTVTDANACQTTRTFTVNQPTALSAATGGGSTNISCNGGANGTATVAPTGGTPSYTYSWAPSGGTNATASGLVAGTYTVTVTDANTCQTQRTFNLTEPAAALSAATGGGSTNISCNGGANGTATVAPTGGTPSYSYSWAPSGGTNATATGLAAGTYTVTVTDANSCQAQRTFNLTEPAAALSTATGGGKTDVSCNGGTNGTATVAPTGGTPSYTYSWAPSGGTAATATGLTAGTYTVTVTDANSCQDQRTFTIDQPTALSAATGGGSTNISCNGGANGTATVAPTGGTPSYTYSWAPSGGTNATAAGLTAGTYTVTVTDANACQTTRTFNLTEPAVLDAATGGGKTDVSCNGGTNGSATVAPTGGTPSYTYSWAPSGGTNATASGLAAGTYTVTVTDANACQTTRTFTIDEPTALDASSGSTVNVSCHNGSNGSATVAPTGGTPGYTYSWAPTGGTAATATGLAAGTYTVTVTDANACQDNQTFIVSEPDTLALTISAQTNLTCNGDSIGSATISVTGGTAAYDFSWSPSGGTAATATELSAGTYTVTVTDANGCDETQSVIITEPAAITENDSHTSCGTYVWGSQSHAVSGVYTQVFSSINGCDSTVTLTLTVNQPSGSSVSVISCANSYTWAQNGMTYNTSGSYEDTIPNAVGCDSIITLNLTLSGSVQSQSVTVCGTYTWSQTGITYTASGTYSDTLTNVNGCDSILVLNLVVNANPVATITDNGNGTLTASSGNSYQWINCTTNTAISGATSQTFAPTVNGNYAVLVTNAAGCGDTSACVLVDDLGLEDLDSKSVLVFPNPTENNVTISMTFADALLTITDAQGKTHYVNQVTNGQLIDLSSYEDGVYFLSIETESGKVLKRIVKQ